MAESWLPVPGYEGLYEVSDHGSVSTARRQGSPGGLLKATPDQHGYLRVKLHARDGGKTHRVHELVALAFIGPLPPGQEVRHFDGNQLNNIRTNLVHGIRADQRCDDVRNGVHYFAKRSACGQGHEYTPQSSYWNGKRRVCRTCMRAYRQTYRERKGAHA